MRGVSIRIILICGVFIGAVVTPPAPSPAIAQGQRSQYVTAEGHTMVVIAGPVSVRMGSPLDEAGRQPAPDSAAEPLHTVRIPRSFAISATEITNAQFRKFLAATPHAKAGFRYEESPDRMAEVLARLSPDDHGPVISVTWYEAAMYCNWLSAREGLPQSEWVYPPGPLSDGFSMPQQYLGRLGYRLPTEPEWEFAARAGTSTARFFGDSPDALGEYAWFARRPPRSRNDPVDPADPQRTNRVGLLKPNPFGLYDMYGNVWEWTQDRVERFQTADVVEDTEDPILRISDKDARTRRGGSFSYGASFQRSANRGTVNSLPLPRRDTVGFRVAKTVR